MGEVKEKVRKVTAQIAERITYRDYGGTTTHHVAVCNCADWESSPWAKIGLRDREGMTRDVWNHVVNRHMNDTTVPVLGSLQTPGDLEAVLARREHPSAIEDPAELARLAAADALPNAERDGRYADFVDMAEDLWGVDGTVSVLARFGVPLPLLEKLASRYRADHPGPLANPSAAVIADTWNANQTV
jgi:hypothetical protein